MTHSFHRFLSFAGLALIACVDTQHAAAQSLPGARRVAIIVGSNAAPPGRHDLRYAQDDARAVGRVLTQLGGFAASDVDVLLEPSPSEVIAAVRRRMQSLVGVPGDSILVFHYAGHADAQGLFPGGALLPYEQLRAELAGPGATVRIGIVDACRGGGWTGTRGLSEAAPFEVDAPMDLANQGTVLVASSSGLEDAHESETIHGGFFTHHWVAALRGAGDQSGDGVVSLTEAFEYAKRLTVRDSASAGADPQHPSFRMNVSGRADVPITRIAASDSTLIIDQTEGPTQLIHLDAGLLVLELPAGPRTAHLALMPGRYLVRVRRATTTHVTELSLLRHTTMTVHESELVAVSSSSIIARGEGQRATEAATPAGVWDVRLAMGVKYQRQYDYLRREEDVLQNNFAALASASYGLPNGAFWQFPLIFGVRLGAPGRTALVPWFGLESVFFSSVSSGAELGMGLRTETPIGAESAFITNAELSYGASRHDFGDRVYLTVGFQYKLGAALRYSLGNRVDLGLGLSIRESLWYGLGEGHVNRPTIEIGSLYRLGRTVPLVCFHMSRVFSIDAYMFLTRYMETRRWGQSFLLGINATWPGRRLRQRD